MHDSEIIAFPTGRGAAPLPFGTDTDWAVRAVDPRRETRPLTFGGCIAGVCEVCGQERGEGLLRFAVNAGIVVFPGWRQVEIAPRDPRTDGLTNQHQVTGLIRYFLQDDLLSRPAVRIRVAGSRRAGARSAVATLEPDRGTADGRGLRRGAVTG